MRLRDELTTLADRAGPLNLDPRKVIARTRRRRIAVVAGTVTAVLGLAATGLFAATTGSRGITPAVGPSYPRPFVCGEQLLLGPGATDTQLGLTMALSKVRKVDDTTGPELEVTITADRFLHVGSGPPQLYEVLYLRDGIIVGGGPMLNEPGDLSGQGMVLIGGPFDVGIGQPFIADLGPRNRLCPGLSWPAIWSESGQYEAVLVKGPVTPSVDEDHVRLDIAWLGYWPLMVSRAPFPA